MGTRVDLQSKLEELLGSKEVYYNRPEDRLMEYPAIVYSKIKPRTAHAGNSIYKIEWIQLYNTIFIVSLCPSLLTTIR